MTPKALNNFDDFFADSQPAATTVAEPPGGVAEFDAFFGDAPSTPPAAAKAAPTTAPAADVGVPPQPKDKPKAKAEPTEPDTTNPQLHARASKAGYPSAAAWLADNPDILRPGPQQAGSYLGAAYSPPPWDRPTPEQQAQEHATALGVTPEQYARDVQAYANPSPKDRVKHRQIALGVRARFSGLVMDAMRTFGGDLRDPKDMAKARAMVATTHPEIGMASKAIDRTAGANPREQLEDFLIDSRGPLPLLERVGGTDKMGPNELMAAMRLAADWERRAESQEHTTGGMQYSRDQIESILSKARAKDEEAGAPEWPEEIDAELANVDWIDLFRAPHKQATMLEYANREIEAQGGETIDPGSAARAFYVASDVFLRIYETWRPTTKEIDAKVEEVRAAGYKKAFSDAPDYIQQDMVPLEFRPPQTARNIDPLALPELAGTKSGLDRIDPYIGPVYREPRKRQEGPIGPPEGPERDAEVARYAELKKSIEDGSSIFRLALLGRRRELGAGEELTVRVAPPAGLDTKALDMVSRLAAFIAQIAILRKAVPPAAAKAWPRATEAAVWEAQSLASGGSFGEGASMALALSAFGEISKLKALGRAAPPIALGAQGGALFTLAMAQGAELEDAIMMSLVPAAFAGLRGVRAKFRSIMAGTDIVKYESMKDMSGLTRAMDKAALKELGLGPNPTRKQIIKAWSLKHPDVRGGSDQAFVQAQHAADYLLGVTQMMPGVEAKGYRVQYDVSRGTYVVYPPARAQARASAKSGAAPASPTQGSSIVYQDRATGEWMVNGPDGPVSVSNMPDVSKAAPAAKPAQTPPAPAPDSVGLVSGGEGAGALAEGAAKPTEAAVAPAGEAVQPTRTPIAKETPSDTTGEAEAATEPPKAVSERDSRFRLLVDERQRILDEAKAELEDSVGGDFATEGRRAEIQKQLDDIDKDLKRQGYGGKTPSLEDTIGPSPDVQVEPLSRVQEEGKAPATAAKAKHGLQFRQKVLDANGIEGRVTQVVAGSGQVYVKWDTGKRGWVDAGEVTPAPVEAPAKPAAKQPAPSAAAVRLAKSNGIDIESVEGTGKDGKVLSKDVKAAVEAKKPAKPTPPAVEAKPAPATPPAVEAKQPWQMGAAEWDIELRARKVAAIAAWNKAGSKGFPPGVGIDTVSNRTELAEQAGYVLPRDADKVIKLPFHQLSVEAAIARGDIDSHPDYPDLQKPAPDVPQEREALARRIAEASRRRGFETIVERVEHKGSDGKWYTTGRPRGVTDTGETRAYFVTQTKDGTTVGKRFDTQAEGEKHLQDRSDAAVETFYKELLTESDERVAEQAAYWLKEKEPPVSRQPVAQTVAKPTSKAAEWRKELRELKKQRFKTGIDEIKIARLEKKLKHNEKRWNVGQGVAWRVTKGQTNRGYRIVSVDTENKTAVIRAIKDVGVLANYVHGQETAVEMIDLVRDKKFDAPAKASEVSPSKTKGEGTTEPTTPEKAVEGKRADVRHHVAIYNGKRVVMDNVENPKDEFKRAAMRIYDNNADGYVVTPKGEVFKIVRGSKLAKRVSGDEKLAALKAASEEKEGAAQPAAAKAEAKKAKRIIPQDAIDAAKERWGKPRDPRLGALGAIDPQLVKDAGLILLGKFEDGIRTLGGMVKALVPMLQKARPDMTTALATRYVRRAWRDTIDDRHRIERIEKDLAEKERAAGLRASKKQLAQAHIISQRLKLTDAEYGALAEELTGKDSMADMNQVEADTFVAALKAKTLPRVKAGKAEAAEGSAWDTFTASLAPTEQARVSKAAGESQVVRDRVASYAETFGHLPAEVGMRKAYIRDLVQVTRSANKGIARQMAAAAEGTAGKLNFLNPWSSMRYAMAAMEAKTATPLYEPFTETVALSNAAEQAVTKDLENRVKAIGRSMFSMAIHQRHNEQIADWLFEQDAEKRTPLWDAMDSGTQAVAQMLHEWTQDTLAESIRHARWIQWDRADRSLQPRIDALVEQIETLRVSKPDSPQIEKLSNELGGLRHRLDGIVPANAPPGALEQGRAAKADGNMEEWIATQTWGTRAHYYMAEQETTDLVDDMLPSSVSEELEPVDRKHGVKPQATPEGLATRKEGASRRKGEPVIQSLLRHHMRAARFVATADRMEEFLANVKQATQSSRDLKVLDAVVRNMLGEAPEGHAGSIAGIVLAPARVVNKLFWRTYLSAPPTAGAFAARNLLQNLAYASAHFSVPSFLRAGARMARENTLAPGILEWMDSSWKSRVSQRKQIQHQMMLMTESNAMARVGTRAGVLLDQTGAMAVYSDEINRSMVGPIAYQMAYDLSSQYQKGKVTWNALERKLGLLNILPQQRLMLQRILASGDLQAFAGRYAEIKIENIHFRYETPLRAGVEQTPDARLITGLYTYFRGVWDQVYQNGVKPAVEGTRTGNTRMLWASATFMAKLFLGMWAAKELWEKAGKKAYGIVDTLLNWAPTGPGYSKILETFEGATSTLRRSEERGDSWDVAAGKVVDSVADDATSLIPFADAAATYYEAVRDKYRVRAWTLIKSKAIELWTGKEGKPFQKYDRTVGESLMHALWGGFEKPPKGMAEIALALGKPTLDWNKPADREIGMAHLQALKDKGITLEQAQSMMEDLIGEEHEKDLADYEKKMAEYDALPADKKWEKKPKRPSELKPETIWSYKARLAARWEGHTYIKPPPPAKEVPAGNRSRGRPQTGGQHRSRGR